MYKSMFLGMLLFSVISAHAADYSRTNSVNYDYLLRQHEKNKKRIAALEFENESLKGVNILLSLQLKETQNRLSRLLEMLEEKEEQIKKLSFNIELLEEKIVNMITAQTRQLPAIPLIRELAV